MDESLVCVAVVCVRCVVWEGAKKVEAQQHNKWEPALWSNLKRCIHAGRRVYSRLGAEDRRASADEPRERDWGCKECEGRTEKAGKGIPKGSSTRQRKARTAVRWLPRTARSSSRPTISPTSSRLRPRISARPASASIAIPAFLKVQCGP